MAAGKVSIIVPAYNAEKTIDRCLKSICEQSYKNLQIIVVNDGSTDRTSELIEKWVQHDSRIEVIHQNNQGLANARNAGMDRASGDFVGFVDSDDFLEPQMYENMVQAAEKHGADIVSVSIRELFSNDVITESKHDADAPVISGLEATCNLLHYSGGVRPMVWDKLYRAELLKDIRFEKNYRYAEDMPFSFQALLKCNQFCRIDYIGYIYDHTESVLTTGNYKSAIMNNVYGTEKIENVCQQVMKEERFSQEEKRLLQDAIMYFSIYITRAVFHNLMLKGDYKGKDAGDYRYLKKKAKTFDLAVVRTKLSSKDYLQWLLYIYCPRGFLLAYRINHAG